MSDDLNKKIKQITDILSQENLPENFKGLLNMLAAGSGGKDETSSHPAESHPSKEGNKSDFEDNTDMVGKIRNVMDRLNTANDPRVTLLNAIKPFLSNRRQKKVNNCLRLLQMSSLTRLMDDNSDKGGL